MSYSPPARNAANIQLLSGYSAPNRSVANMYLGETLTPVIGWTDLLYSLTETITGLVNIDYGLIATDLSGWTELVYGLADEILIDGVDITWHAFIQDAVIIDLPYMSLLADSCVLAWRTAWEICGSTAIDYNLIGMIAGSTEISYALCGIEIVGWVDIVYSFETMTEITGSCELVFLNIAPSYDTTLTTPIPTATVTDEDGHSQPLTSITDLKLQRRRDQYYISGTIDFAEAVDYLACELGRTVTISIAGTSVVLRVYDRSRPRQHGDWRYSISLASPAYWRDAPYAEKVEGELTGLASDIASQLAGGITVQWQTVDWNVASGTLTAANDSPITLMRNLAAAPGGVLQSGWNGDFIIQPEYPISISEWLSAVPALTIVESREVISADTREEYRTGINAVVVTNSTTENESEGLKMESETNNDGSVTWRVYSEPWDDSVTMRHTGGDWVSLQLVGDKTMELTETVAIVDGSGATAYPVIEVVSTDWREADLGAVEVTASGTITAGIPGESLLEISYNTRFREWLAIDPVEEDVQFVAEGEGPVLSGFVSVYYQRDPGDHSGDDIVDSLITSFDVAMERGRNHVDHECSQRQVVPLTCPLTALHEMGILVEVFDVERPAWRGALVAQDINWTVADDGAQDITTTYEIEREAA